MSFNLLWLIVCAGVVTARLIPKGESSSTTPPPFSGSGVGGSGGTSIRCSASPEGNSKYNLLKEFNEFMTTNAKFLRISYTNLSEPQGELFSAFVNQLRNQNIQKRDADNLLCEFGSRTNLLSATNYAINSVKIRELINELPVDQQQKDTFSNNIKTCADDLARGNSSCDLSVFYECLRNKCERGGSGGSGFQGGSGFPQDSGFSGGSGNQGGSGFQGGSGNQGGSGFQGGSGNQGGSGIQGGSGFQGGIGNQGGSGFPQGPGFQGGSTNRGESGFSGDSGFQGGSTNRGESGFSGDSGFQGGSGNQGEFGIPELPGLPNESGDRRNSANRG